jgi:hypothetical protein
VRRRADGKWKNAGLFGASCAAATHAPLRNDDDDDDDVDVDDEEDEDDE